METPILDAIRQFRENRPERVAARRDRIRDLLTPFSSDEPAAEPASRIGKFLRSLGAGSSRQDLMPERKSILMPEARSPQTYANGPDTGADAGKRAYDGDGNLPDNPAMVLPNPAIQGGTTSLPAVPPMALPRPTARTADDYTAEIEQLRQNLTKPMKKDERVAIEKQIGLTIAERARLEMRQEEADALARADRTLKDERDYTEGREEFKARTITDANAAAEASKSKNELALQQAKIDAESLPAMMRQAEISAENAYETTNWQAFNATVLSSNLVQRGMDKLPVPGADASVKELSRAPISRKAAEKLQQFGGLAAMPPEETLKLSSALAYAYPVTPGIKGSAAITAEIARVQQQMNQTMNLTNDQKMFDYLGKLAHMVVYNAVGRTQAAAPASMLPAVSPSYRFQ